MNAKKFFLVLFLVAGIALSGDAQSTYRSAIGLRLGYPVSVSYKHFIGEPSAIEVFAGFRSWSGYGWINIGGLYQYHKPISGVDGLQWYFGGGASVFFWNYKSSFGPRDQYDNTSFGLLGALGLDYKFADAPVNLSVDWIPTIFLNGYGSGFGGGYGALSARYTLN